MPEYITGNIEISFDVFNEKISDDKISKEKNF